ncbi:MAG: C_GCAxxG_C_C family protein [bacterium]|nr:C_GCAxxG_C_C family protein [bacterium]
MTIDDSKTNPKDARKMFRKLGTCSRTFCFLLNRAFDHQNEIAEQAADPFAGGIIRKGHQCGMLWGSILAAGAESFRRNENRDQAVAAAVNATQRIMESFMGNEKTTDCRDVTRTNFNSIFSFVKYMITGRFLYCFRMADKWAADAIRTAEEGLEQPADHSQPPLNCACEVAKKMGASDEETVMVAGFAGGMGLSGKGCGALGAAIWIKALDFYRKNPGKSPMTIPGTKEILDAFLAETGSEMLCSKITGCSFKTIDEHTEFMKKGGCDKLLEVLAQS